MIDDIDTMNATEIIEQIKGLSPEEKGEIVQFLHEENLNAIRIADDKVVWDAVESIFSEHSDLFKKLAQ